MKGRTIYPGRVKAKALVSLEPIGFYGGVDVKTGRIVEKGHPLEGKVIRGRILVFPHGKGSTVGSYIIYGLKKLGNAPIAMVTREIDTVTLAGVIMAGIRCVDGIEIEKIEDGRIIEVRADKGEVILD